MGPTNNKEEIYIALIRIDKKRRKKARKLRKMKKGEKTTEPERTQRE